MKTMQETQYNGLLCVLSKENNNKVRFYLQWNHIINLKNNSLTLLTVNDVNEILNTRHKKTHSVTEWALSILILLV